MRFLLRTKPLAELLAETTEEGHRLNKTLRAWTSWRSASAASSASASSCCPASKQHARRPWHHLVIRHRRRGLRLRGVVLRRAPAMIPVAGSAYTYGYATLGEIFGFVIAGLDPRIHGRRLPRLHWLGRLSR